MEGFNAWRNGHGVPTAQLVPQLRHAVASTYVYAAATVVTGPELTVCEPSLDGHVDLHLRPSAPAGCITGALGIQSKALRSTAGSTLLRLC